MGDYHLLEEWADTYEPFTNKEEEKLLEKYPENTSELMLILIKHNSRLIYSLSSKYRNNIAFDDALSIGLTATVKMFETKWDRTYKFNMGVYYAVITALRVALKGNRNIAGNTGEEVVLLKENACYDDFDDFDNLIWNSVKDELTEDEYKFIKLIYFDGLSIAKAGRIIFNNTYRKMSSTIHKKILKRLKIIPIIKKERYE